MTRDRVLDAVWSVCGQLASQQRAKVPVDWGAGEVLREAAGCVLSSQVPHLMAVAAVNRLKRDRLLPPADISDAETRIAAALRTPLSDDYHRSYRFPSVAARRLSRLSGVATHIVDLVLRENDLAVARRSMISLRCGLGPKQASLLLRNVRSGADLAVLDVHLVGFMRLAGLTEARSVPTTLAGYEALEDRLRGYAHGLCMPIQRLDLAAWVVMRATTKGESEWQS